VNGETLAHWGLLRKNKKRGPLDCCILQEWNAVSLFKKNMKRTEK
jgi:hypothetical protein